MDTSNMSAEQKAAVEEGLALAKEYGTARGVAVLAVALANATAKLGHIPDVLAGRIVGACTVLFNHATAPSPKGAVARKGN